MASDAVISQQVKPFRSKISPPLFSKSMSRTFIPEMQKSSGGSKARGKNCQRVPFCSSEENILCSRKHSRLENIGASPELNQMNFELSDNFSPALQVLKGILLFVEY